MAFVDMSMAHCDTRCVTRCSMLWNISGTCVAYGDILRQLVFVRHIMTCDVWHVVANYDMLFVADWDMSCVVCWGMLVTC